MGNSAKQMHFWKESLPMLVRAYPVIGPLVEEGLLEDFLVHLGFIHANDHCYRNCFHCPAYGSRLPLKSMPFASLKRVVAELGQAYADYGMRPLRSIASWRISEPFDYYVKEEGRTRTTYDVARLWLENLGQGLYIVTNGTEGKKFARESLLQLVNDADLISQIKLTITPFDTEWGSPKYFDDISWDVSTLAQLWELPSTRIEDPNGARFRINVKVTEETRENACQFVAKVLERAGYAHILNSLMSYREKIAIKPLYDLGSYTGNCPVPGAIKITRLNGERYKPTPETRDRYQYGIYTDGQIKIVDLYAFREIPIFARNGSTLRINLNS
jgi:hypothetical protein